jgi:hypothetical protein
MNILKNFIRLPILFFAGIMTYFLTKSMFVWMLNAGGINTATWDPLVTWMMPLFPIFVLGVFLWWAFYSVSKKSRSRSTYLR